MSDCDDLNDARLKNIYIGFSQLFSLTLIGEMVWLLELGLTVFTRSMNYYRSINSLFYNAVSCSRGFLREFNPCLRISWRRFLFWFD